MRLQSFYNNIKFILKKTLKRYLQLFETYPTKTLSLCTEVVWISPRSSLQSVMTISPSYPSFIFDPDEGDNLQIFFFLPASRIRTRALIAVSWGSPFINYVLFARNTNGKLAYQTLLSWALMKFLAGMRWKLFCDWREKISKEVKLSKQFLVK